MQHQEQVSVFFNKSYTEDSTTKYKVTPFFVNLAKFCLLDLKSADWRKTNHNYVTMWKPTIFQKPVNDTRVFFRRHLSYRKGKHPWERGCVVAIIRPIQSLQDTPWIIDLWPTITWNTLSWIIECFADSATVLLNTLQIIYSVKRLFWELNCDTIFF